MQRDWYANAIRQQFPLTGDVQRLINAATFDLYYGPLSVGEDIDNEWVYPGFGTAVDQIRDALDDVSELWIDRDSDCVSDREPQGEEIDGEWSDPGGEWWHLERRDVLKLLVGRELAQYVA